MRVEVDGVAVADTTSARLLFETMLGPRFYLPRQDVRMDLLTPSPTTTTCAYKGHASYWSVTIGATAHPDLVWTYEHPLPDATQVAGLLCFFDEHVDVIVDGEPRERPVTPGPNRPARNTPIPRTAWCGRGDRSTVERNR